MAWKGIGIKDTLTFWQAYYLWKYGVLFDTLEKLDEYLEKKNRTTSI